uniref:Reverse transcriptase domain-containing protein n=1 Tax=Cannabis sativa TaxID=3483 RepID=A0A803NXT3_CANSA
MKLLSWNCRGLGSPSTKESFRALVTQEDPDVLFLMETKLSSPRMNGIWRSLGFGGASVVAAIGSAGGTCLCWKAGVELQVLSESVGVTKVVFSNILNGPDWYSFFVYGPPTRAARKDFWEERTMDVLALNHPWLLMGDLNTITGQQDKFGGREVEESDGSDLNDLLDATGGVDLGCVGNLFTWTNGRNFQDLIKERLDRALCDPEWMVSYERQGYLDAWSRDEGCKAVIQQAWAIDVRGVRSFQLIARLDNTRRCLAKWNKTHFGMCKEKLKTLNNLLLEVQRRTPSESNLKLEADILLEIDEVESLCGNLEAKVRELECNGDRNSKFFHAATVIKRKRNFINAVCLNGSDWIEGRQLVGEYFRSNFVSILSSTFPPDPLLDDLVSNSISEEANQSLVRVPSAEEIKKVVWSMPSLKAPGPDGMPGKFFKDHWEIVGSDVVATVIQFFETGEFVKEINQTFIVLIPKKIGAKCFDEFRPISLCNFTYKIISKILANRLRPLLQELISPYQSAFVPGRWIAENSIMAHEVLDSFNKLKGRDGFVGLKLDMSKAYDRIEWSFLRRTMEAFGFESRFIQLVMKCISSVSFSILLNGGPLKQFCPGRGLRQGDPISPYLFILCSEVLSRMLLRKEETGLLSGFKVSPQSPSISHLMYADDIFVFCKANLEEVGVVMDVVQLFGSWSDQCLNVQKSAYICSKNVNEDIQAELSQFLGFRKLGKEDRFLGNPIIWSNSKTKDLRYIKDKICSKIEGWRCKLLSQAGRSTLIRAVAQSTPVYSMATYLFPKTLCHEMDQAIRKFWWMGSESKDRFLALCDWNSLCLPLDRGGLNFKKFGDVNLALGRGFWNWLPRNASFGAKGIMAARDLIRNEACWVLADGGKADLWASPWIPWLDWDKSRAAFNPLCVPNPIKVSTLIGADGEWIASSVQRWFVPSVASSLHLIQRLPSSQDDLLVWKDATNGMFSPSVAYKSIIKSRWGETDQIWLRIWKLQLTERLKMFLWKLCRDIIPFGNRLQRIFGNSTRCVICGAAEDSALHLFFKCPLAKAVWFASRWAIRSDTLNFGAPRDMVVWLLSPEFLKVLIAEVLGEFLRFGVCLFDALWTARNRAFHDQISPTWRGVLAKVTSAVAYLLSAWESPTTAGGGLQPRPIALYRAGTGWLLPQIVNCWCMVYMLGGLRLAGVFSAVVEMLDALPDVKIEWTPRAGVLAAHKLAKWAILHSVSGLFSAEDLVPLVAM